ncbi:hypothetical protein MBGDC06_00669 [Thermoplasmatales archaeon SCGC AB-539-C06]|nr:hypothetical protein MBGDC06_00669 [Thermoplasmatales archaeon SCGC AB-539-C06]
MYLCDGQDRKREILKSFNVDFRNSMEFFDQETINCIVIVDGLNISYRNNKAVLRMLSLLISIFRRKVLDGKILALSLMRIFLINVISTEIFLIITWKTIVDIVRFPQVNLLMFLF